VKFLLTAIAALFLSVAPPSIAQDTANKNTYTPTPSTKLCSKISEIDRLLTSSGETLFVQSKSYGDSEEFKINIYVNQKDRKFTVVKTYAKRNQACIVMSGYDIELKNMKAVKPEQREEEQ
jgi:hypothetical protein